MKKTLVKGDICFTKTINEFCYMTNGYILAEDGVILDVFCECPSVDDAEFLDCSGKLIIPGFVDLHTHAPQFMNLGLGLNMELLPWLRNYTFPEESKFSDVLYAQETYSKFVNELYKNGTTRSVVFGTIHTDSTLVLKRLFQNKGLSAFIGKVNMNANAPDFLCESEEESISETLRFLKADWTENVRPIITPRFVPSCSQDLLEALGKLAKEQMLQVQSHLNENNSEIAWVSELFPEIKTYGGVYDRFGLLGSEDGSQKSIMAHCIYCNDFEIELMKKNGVFVAHCPVSNADLASGIAPVRKYLNSGLNMGLGSDISGGHSLYMPDVIVSAIECSKLLYARDNSLSFLTAAEAFYLATKGGGSFFGKVGSFERGFELDFLVVDDNKLSLNREMTSEERIQRFIYNGKSEMIEKRCVRGCLI